MKKILTVLMIAMLLTALAMPQDKQEAEVASVDTAYYAMEKADLTSAYNDLVKQRASIDKQLENIVWAHNYFNALEKARAEKAEPEETK